MRLSEVLPTDARAVQCTLFVKSIASNWLVSLHQGLTRCINCHIKKRVPDDFGR
jgi:hypothetical protein